MPGCMDICAAYPPHRYFSGRLSPFTALRILRMSEAPLGSSGQSDHKFTTGRGGHRIEASRNFWDGSGLKVDSSSTDVAWCHGSMSTFDAVPPPSLTWLP